MGLILIHYWYIKIILETQICIRKTSGLNLFLFSITLADLVNNFSELIEKNSSDIYINSARKALFYFTFYAPLN